MEPSVQDLVLENPLFARQPIFDRKTTIVGYELLYRGTLSDTAVFTDGSLASARVLLNALTEVDLRDTVDNTRAFINFTEEMLAEVPDYARKHLVIELLEDIPVTDKLLFRLKDLQARGFTIALDDYGVRQLPAELLNMVDIIKVDLLSLPKSHLADLVDSLEPYNAQLLAEKVETVEMYEHCLALGFDMFQGYFFSRPEMVTGATLGTDRRVVLELIGTLFKPDVEVKDVVRSIERDPALTVKLLRLANSALYRRRREIQSIHQAIAMLGLNRLRSWVTLLLLDDHTDRSHALQDMTLFQAHFCQMLAHETRPDMEGAAFTVGLLGHLDGYFGRPMKELLTELPLDKVLNVALLDSRGRLGAWLRLARFLQRASVDRVADNALERLGIKRDALLAACRTLRSSMR